MKIVWSPLALEKLVEIGEFIARDRPNAAADWVEGILTAVEQLEHFPRSGRPVPESNRSDLRELLHGEYRVIHRVETDHLVILTLRHSRQVLRPEDPELR